MKLSFAQWFKLRRDLIGFTQAEVAKYIGITPQTVSNWENQISSPTLNPKQMQKLCELLDISFEDLVTAFEGKLTIGE